MSTLYSKGFTKSQNHYYRLIIPLSQELWFHLSIQEIPFKTDLGYIFRNGLIADIRNQNVHVCSFHNKKREFYLSIESVAKQSFHNFSSLAHAIKNAIGFITGHLPGNRGYFFAYQNGSMQTPSHFYFTAFRHEIISPYKAVYSNPFGFIHNKKLAEKYYKSKALRPLSLAEFSTLSEKILSSVELESTLILILESSVASLLFTPGGYSIALESLADIIIGDQKIDLAPIKSKQLSKKIRKECKEIIQKYSTDLTLSDIQILLKKIDHLNQTTNKSRLEAPFKILDIKLLPEDLKIINTRNDFLHGKIPDLNNEGPLRSINRKNKDLYYASLRLYTLLNLIVLKWIGYNNYIINHPQLQSTYCQINLREEAYRKI